MGKNAGTRLISFFRLQGSKHESVSRVSVKGSSRWVTKSKARLGMVLTCGHS